MVVGDVTVNPVAGVPPKVTDVASVRWLPVMVTDVPPVVRPVAGTIVARLGAGATKLNSVGALTVPAGAVTVTVTLPGAWAGVVAVIFAVDAVKVTAAVVPKVTA